ncbi:MAG: RNA polymerase sigma factor RpoH [Proteobacteria bacterium]|nr:RNA polymerase sigma factor RpoH [Pseudomonadota bacterium]
MATKTLPVLTDAGLTHYLQEINKFPMLEEQEEFMLAKAWRDHGDTQAAEKLVTSHLRLVAKLAMGFRGYGLPLVELISEGNIGLMHAVKKFDPDKGFRLSTYAMWWIKAAIQEYVLRSWSMVKMGTTAAQKKLFFNLRRVKNRIANHHGDLTPDEVKQVAKELSVPEEDVVDMDRRMFATDQSLNNTFGDEDGEGVEFIDNLADERDDQEVVLGNMEDYELKRRMLASAIKVLNEREMDILFARQMQEVPATLEDLSQKYDISRERVRQIETRAIEKLQAAVKNPKLLNAH